MINEGLKWVKTPGIAQRTGSGKIVAAALEKARAMVAWESGVFRMADRIAKLPQGHNRQATHHQNGLTTIATLMLAL